MVNLFFDNKDSNNTRFIAFCVFLIVAYFAFRVFIPGDILTSARFYDGMGLQKIFAQEFQGNWLGQKVSFEGASFGIILFVIQIAFGYLIIQEKNKKTATAYQVLYWSFIFLDVFTDSDFRSFSWMNGFIAFKAVMVSFFLYNVLSEWATIVSIRVLMDTWPSVILILIDMTMAVVKVMDQVKKKVDSSGKPSFQPPKPPGQPMQRPQKMQMPQTRNIPPEVLAKMKGMGVQSVED